MAELIVVTEEGFAPDAWHESSQIALGDLTAAASLPAMEKRVLQVMGDDDPALILPHLHKFARIAISFPTAQDGRGFSLARLLRDAGYEGKLRAIGPLITDQYRHLRQSGFDELAITPSHAERMPEQHWLDVIGLALPSYQGRLIRYD